MLRDNIILVQIILERKFFFPLINLLYPETNIWEVSRPVLEDWLKDIKSPKSSLDTAINTSAEIIKRIPDFPDLMENILPSLDFSYCCLVRRACMSKAQQILTSRFGQKKQFPHCFLGVLIQCSMKA